MSAQHSPKSLYAQGKDLDRIGMWLGFKRRRYFWIFKESDRSFRERMVRYLK